MTARNGTPFTSSTATVELENNFLLCPDIRPFNLVRDQMRRVAKLAEETKLPKFTYPTAPSRTQRYSFNSTIKSGEPRRVIKRSSIFYRPELALPLGWEQHIHPEGSPYFVSYRDDSQTRRIVTEEWMYDPKISTLILDFIKQIQGAIFDQELNLWPESDLYLELRRDQAELIENQDGHIYCGYYFVHNPSRCIYWPGKVTLKPFPPKNLNSVWEGLSGYQSQLCPEAEYWTYWNHFPSLQSVTPDIYDYVIVTIMCVMTSVISAPRDVSADFTYQELQKTLKLIRMEKDCNMSSWHIGHFMMRLTQDRFRNYYGAQATRLHETQPVARVEYEPQSMAVNILSPLLFFIPHAQLERAEMMVIDRCITSHQWESFLDEIQDEWSRTALSATIVLAANCALLAIPMFQDTTRVAHSSLEQVSSYLSLTTSLLGFILAFVFYRRHKAGRASLPGGLFAYIHESNEGDVDYKRFEHLLLLWSVPHALVAWSVIAFFLAFLSMGFFGTFTPTKVAIGLFTFVLGSSTFYYNLVKFGGGSKLFRTWFDRTLRTLSRPLHLSNQGVTYRHPGYTTSTPPPSSIDLAHDK